MLRQLLLLSIAITTIARAQELTGPQRGTSMGFDFDIPDGWAGVAGAEGYVIGHATVPGAILLSAQPHASMADLVRAFTDPTDDETTSLRLVGAPRISSDSTVVVTQTGTMQGTAVKVIACARLNPYGGNTANLMALAPAESFTPELEAALLATLATVRYNRTRAVKTPAGGSVDATWKSRLAGARLTYMESYSSPSSTEGGIGGGYSINRRIDLCPEGYYRTDSRSEHSFSGSEVSAYGSGNDSGEGTWQALKLGDGSSVLRLTARDGRVTDYRLGFDGGKTFLNGERWYRTTLAADGTEYAPDCP
ncbi:MAG: hypothetical protein H6591_03685 [Flavobacteriales bacterium]|nr:hypothetical protein [Flavobacteriales bacterium]